jgi:hypothetical protein
VIRDGGLRGPDRSLTSIGNPPMVSITNIKDVRFRIFAQPA